MPGALVANGDRVTLRTSGRDDLHLHDRQNNPELRLPIGTPVGDLPSLEEFIEGGFGDFTPLVVCLDEDGAGPGSPDEDAIERIGLAAIEDRGGHRPELSYFILPEYHGQGFGKEAVGLAVDITFQEHHHPAVEAKTFPDNEASRGLLESLGFTQEGRIRNHAYWDGQYRDMIIYGLLRGEWHDQDHTGSE